MKSIQTNFLSNVDLEEIYISCTASSYFLTSSELLELSHLNRLYRSPVVHVDRAPNLQFVIERLLCEVVPSTWGRYPACVAI